MNVVARMVTFPLLTPEDSGSNLRAAACVSVSGRFINDVLSLKQRVLGYHLTIQRGGKICRGHHSMYHMVTVNSKGLKKYVTWFEGQSKKSI